MQFYVHYDIISFSGVYLYILIPVSSHGSLLVHKDAAQGCDVNRIFTEGLVSQLFENSIRPVVAVRML
jgi:hypothetical protein